MLIRGASALVQGYWPTGTICPGRKGMGRCHLLPQQCQAAKMAKAVICGTEKEVK